MLKLSMWVAISIIKECMSVSIVQLHYIELMSVGQQFLGPIEMLPGFMDPEAGCGA